MSRARLGAAAVVAAALALWAFVEPPSNRTVAERVSSATSSDSTGARSAPDALVVFPSDRPGAAPRPGSLRGTDVDGGLVIDAEGHFVVTRDAIEMFDYFFVASGEESDEAIVRRIRAEIERRLPPGEREAALALLARYLAYREAAAALARDGSTRSPAEAFERVVELRHEIFGEDADVLFGDEEARVRISLAQREIARDSSLTEAERQALIEALYAELPEEQRLARERAIAPARLRASEAALREAGAGDADIRAHRTELFGEEAADRLAALDRERAAWDARLEEYRRARDAVLADPSLGPQQRDAAVRALLEANFDGPERLRVEALDRIAAQKHAS